MMSASRYFAALLAAALLAAASPGRAVLEGALHLGNTGDIRALHLVGSTLWVGTGDGLFRYDTGSDELIDHITLGESLPSNSVRAIASTGDSVVVGTDGGLAIFTGSDARVFTNGSSAAYDSLVFSDIRAIDFGRGDTVYLGTFGHGLGVMTPDGGHMITRADSLLDNKVYGVEEEWIRNEDGELEPAYYYATSMGLCAWRDSVWVNFQAGAGIPRGEVRRIFAHGGQYYLLVGVGGVYRFDGNRARDISPRGVLPGDDIADITVDGRGVIWAVGRFGGVAVYQGGNWRSILDDARALGGARWRSAASAGDAVFFGSADGLVAMVRDNVLDTFRIPPQLPSGAVRSFVALPQAVFCLSGPRVVRLDVGGADIVIERSPPGVVTLAKGPADGLWTAGRWGIHQRGAGGEYREFVTDINSPEPSFTALVFDAGGQLWTATRTGAVYRYDGEVWLQMAQAGELGSVGGLRASGREVYAFSPRRLSRFDGRVWTPLPVDTLGDDIVDIALAPGDTLVAATASRVWRYRPEAGRWQAFVTGAGEPVVAPPARALRCLALDAGGYLYLGTARGLGVVGGDLERWIDPRSGIGGAEVIALCVEDERYLWIGFRTDGLTRVPLESLWQPQR